MSVMHSSKNIGLFAVILLIIGAIDNIRNLPATALFGSALIFFFIFSAFTFLFPTALVSAELSARFPKQGGLYHWTKNAFGDKAAFFAVWLQWINTMVWYPTILSFIAGTATYLLDPKLAQNKFYLASIILSTFWFLTLVNLRGIKTSAKFNNICIGIGMVLPMILIIVLGLDIFRKTPTDSFDCK
jgi:amino acid transporter